MKIRTDFVTNSSSSSFIAIYTGKKRESLVGFDPNEKYAVGEKGNASFERYYEIFDDFDSRLNFVALQAAYAERFANNPKIEYLTKDQRKYYKSWQKNLSIVFRQETELDIDLTPLKQREEDCDAYIDHQSVCSHAVKELFKSKDKLRDFIFGRNSVVIMGDDESDPPATIARLTERLKNDESYDTDNNYWRR